MIRPAISVITPCFNDGKFLHLPLESVRAQSFQDYEHIVVNDGSTDVETLRALKEINDPHVRVIDQLNTGLPGARNSGIREAKGQYILPLDADDKIPPHALARLHAELEAHPHTAVVYGDYQLFGSSERLVRTGNFNTYRILFANCLPVCSMFRRAAWEDVGGYTETMKGFEDWEFWIKLTEKGYTFRKIDEVLYYSQRHEANMWLRDRGKWRSLVAQIRQFHPQLYSREHLAEQRRVNRVTWLEEVVYRLPPPLRYALRQHLSPSLIGVARKAGFYRDY